MEITANRVITIHYTLKDDDGAVLDSSAGGDPLYIQGQSNLLAGLEKALEGKPEGASLAVSDAAADGYGTTRDESLSRRSPRRRSLYGAGTFKKGMQFQARTDGGAGGHHH